MVGEHELILNGKVKFDKFELRDISFEVVLETMAVAD